jgi:Domain of unknown function (DUF5659)
MNQQSYETPNSFVASFLTYCGLVLTEVKNHNGKVSFVFDDPEQEGAQLAQDFWNEQPVVSAKRLLQAHREIRKYVWEARGGTRG